MKKILVVCDHGNNRSVHFAHHLKYLDYDVLTAGLLKNSPDTLDMLYRWADTIITTAAYQHIPDTYASKVTLWDVGKDTYPRPFNPELRQLVRDIIKNNPL